MKQFEKWQGQRGMKTIGYLTNLGAYKAGEENGWRAALEEVLKQISRTPDGSIVNWIEKELRND